ncbi:MAG: hypothetical protein DLM60_07015 [Pseudonocardiales bacterium]|nr:MAG: hypothetical protein DLM60_07015 [Pseudonocardiales bacterium]
MIEFYWRPGCPFCVALRGALRRSGLPVRELNIWTDSQAAARVRRAADGAVKLLKCGGMGSR